MQINQKTKRSRRLLLDEWVFKQMNAFSNSRIRFDAEGGYLYQKHYYTLYYKV